MGFRYLDRVASKDNLHSFLELADLAAGAGESANNVFLLSHRLRQSNPMQVCQRLLERDPASRALIQQRRLSGPYNMEALLALPRGSLGHTYATVMKTMGYDINFFPNPEFYANLESDADYINYRVYATHDLHHILSGFSLDNFGELGVISVSVAQFAHPGLAFTDLMALLLNWFRNDTPLDEHESIRDQVRTAGYSFLMISQGFTIAANAKPLFPVIWEERFEQDLDDLRTELGIEAVREGPWSWYSNPEIRRALGLRAPGS
jgi:ubiquinone biosynthesis protein COQ4